MGERLAARSQPAVTLAQHRDFANLATPPRLRFAVERLDWGVDVSETIQCPFCGQAFDATVDTSVKFQRFNMECEVCCRPFEVIAECEPGEILSLDVVAY